MNETTKKKKEPINFTSLIISLVALILGILLLFNGDEAFFNVLRYIVSGSLLVSGIFKLLVYAIQKKKYNVPMSDCNNVSWFSNIYLCLFRYY